MVPNPEFGELIVVQHGEAFRPAPASPPLQLSPGYTRDAFDPTKLAAAALSPVHALLFSSVALFASFDHTILIYNGMLVVLRVRRDPARFLWNIPLGLGGV